MQVERKARFASQGQLSVKDSKQEVSASLSLQQKLMFSTSQSQSQNQNKNLSQGLSLLVSPSTTKPKTFAVPL